MVGSEENDTKIINLEYESLVINFILGQLTKTPSLMLSHCCLSCEEVSDLHLDHIRKPPSRIEMSGWGAVAAVGERGR